MKLALALLAALAASLPGRALAAAPLEWSTATLIDPGRALSGIACPSRSLCVAVDRSGQVLSSSEPAAGRPWTVATIDGHPLTALSCPGVRLCVAVDEAGQVLVSTRPASSEPGAWSGPRPIDGAGSLAVALSAVSCPSEAICLASDASGAVHVTTAPTAGQAWTRHAIDSHPLTSASCASTQLCVAVDDAGAALATSEPAGPPSSWRKREIDRPLALSGVSCAAAGACVAVDGSGDALASADPAGGAPTWSSTGVDSAALTSVSCASSGLCVAVDGAGEALASDDPVASLPAWSVSRADPGVALRAVSCDAEGLCGAAAEGGRAISGSVPAPLAATSPPAEVTQTSATLAGTVDPEDALLEGCRFEYGSTAAYGQSAPCSALPSPGSASQPVAAALTGLAPASTYHYRLVALTAAGEGLGADVAFTTATASLVQPHPSISGVPAVKSRLTCEPGVPANAQATLAYAWWRDGAPIAGAGSASYRVAPADATHHLQCLVTASDAAGSATGHSAYVTIPAEGVIVSVGETSVGRARAAGSRVSVAVRCSPRAAGSCAIALRLSTLYSVRHRLVSVTVGYLSARLHRGQRRVLSVSLDSLGRRMLARSRRLSVQLSVSGTVIGVLRASLSRQRLTLRAPVHAPAHARVHSRRGRRARSSRLSTAAVVAPTPYMGWDTYFAFGPRYSESTVLAQASALLSEGLAHRGYRYVWLDVGWWQGQRDAHGQIVVNRSQWPHGMAWLARTLHEAGLRVGLYTDAGVDGCGGRRQGSYGHYRQDADTFAAWGFDAVKVDFCGGVRMHLDPAAAYASFHAALQSSSRRRPLLLSICDFLEPGQFHGEPPFGQSAFSSYTFGPSTGNSWRTDTDVGSPGDVAFATVLRNLDADAAHPEAAGPGHWNDPDYLAPDQGLSETQFRAQLSMWALLAAPLMVSDDLQRISPEALSALRDPGVLAIDQDPAGAQGTLVASDGEAQLWVRPLADGSRAVALLNRGPSPQWIAASAAEAGLPAAGRYLVRDAWTNARYTSTGALGATVPGESTVLLRVSVTRKA